MFRLSLSIDLRKQILFKFGYGQWAALCLSDSCIKHAETNFPPLDYFDWFTSVESQFFNLRRFFDALQKPDDTVTRVADLAQLPTFTFTAKLVVDLQPLLDHWEKNLHLKCSQCLAEHSVCTCLITDAECPKTDARRHSRFCSNCRVEMGGAHLLQLDFADIHGGSITVDFSPELMDVFLYPYPANKVSVCPAVYTDFIHTISWHVSRKNIKLPFIQSVVLRKANCLGEITYKFVSGPLQPLLDGNRLVSVFRWEIAIAIYII